MFTKITNTYGLLYAQKQKFVCSPCNKTLGEVYSEITKEKRNFYFKHYKKLLKQKSKKKNNFQNNFQKSSIKSLANPSIILLNSNLTQKGASNIKFLSNNIFYNDLKPIKLKIKKLDGYSQYYDKVFS